MSELHEVLVKLGNLLDFDVRKEVQASDSAFVDLVWFDKRLPVPAGNKAFHMRYKPVLPVVGFEIELHTALNAKHVKGSVSNLSNLGAQLGVIVIGNDNLSALQKQPAQQKKSLKEVKQTLCDRVYRWVYAEAQPRSRIIVMFEDEVLVWLEQTKKSKMAVSQPAIVPSGVPVETTAQTLPAIAMGEV